MDEVQMIQRKCLVQLFVIELEFVIRGNKIGLDVWNVCTLHLRRWELVGKVNVKSLNPVQSAVDSEAYIACFLVPISTSITPLKSSQYPPTEDVQKPNWRVGPMGARKSSPSNSKVNKWCLTLRIQWWSTTWKHYTINVILSYSFCVSLFASL
jgi:hypothetical protein